MSLINFFSLLLPGGGALEFPQVNFCPGGRGLAAFLPGGGDFVPSKNSPGVGPVGGC